jgi:hypothetical protein
MNAFEFASNRIAAAPRSSEGRTEIVVVSDMLEDCKSTPLGESVRLEKQSLRAEIQHAVLFRPGHIVLSGTRITFILPGGYGTVPGPHPRVEELEQFWRGFLANCRLERSASPEVVISPSLVPESLGEE